jgi:hypothetical protein
MKIGFTSNWYRGHLSNFVLVGIQFFNKRLQIYLFNFILEIDFNKLKEE